MRRIILAFLVTASLPCQSDQLLLANADEARKAFWEKVYPGTHYTLYCGERFEKKTEDIDIEPELIVNEVIEKIK